LLHEDEEDGEGEEEGEGKAIRRSLQPDINVLLTPLFSFSL
jgi:hypothetical protein